MKTKHIIQQMVIKTKGTFRVKGKYRVGEYEIETPPNFALPLFQKSFKLYDRFLPVLAKNLKGQGVIIDVGANIGDTAIAMIQKCNNSIICVEPSELFFSYLERNIKSLGDEYLSRIETYKNLVGTGSIKGSLHHAEHGTAGVRVNKNYHSNTHTALDNLIDDISNIELLKVDTDGFDFDVIMSAQEILSRSEPVLFWENQISENFQYTGYKDLYNLLENKGYKYIYIFDNFGNLITEETNFETLRHINSYVYSMEKSNCTRTIYYTDILASTEKNSTIVKKAVDEFKTKWIRKK